jgi:hypothetical protein
MVAGKYGYYWECDDGTVSMDLEAIWGMSVMMYSHHSLEYDPIVT